MIIFHQNTDFLNSRLEKYRLSLQLVISLKVFKSITYDDVMAGIGRAQFLLVGGVNNSYETVLYGDPIYQTTLASEEAVAGDIIFSRRAWQEFMAAVSRRGVKLSGKQGPMR